MAAKDTLRRRITPPVLFTLKVEDETGSRELNVSLAYDLNAFTLVEEEIGLSMLTDLPLILDLPTIRSITVLFWAALQVNHEEDFGGAAGLRLVRSLVGYGDLVPVHEACVEAFIRQLPKEKADALRASIAELKAAKEKEAAEKNKKQGEQPTADPLATEQSVSA